MGERLLVEVDIILPPDCPLKEAHDVGEALQDALELLENVERAFVHLDYNAEHPIEHRRVVDDVGFNT
jgi:divalent metal cation (Fe/Co/Zn/Cd) transporter